MGDPRELHTWWMRRAPIILFPFAVAALVLTACTAPTPGPTAGASASTPAVAAAPEDAFTPVIANVLSTPRAVAATDGRVHIAYELFLSNVTTQMATIESIDVIDEDGQSLAELDGDAVVPWVHVSGTTAQGRMIGPGQSALVWLDVVVDSMQDLPLSLAHDVTFGFEPGALPVIPNEVTERLAVTAVDPAEPIVIAPPLEGEGWLNGNSCCAVTPHRAAVNPIDGSFHAPERYAIDYVQLDENGSFLTGLPINLRATPISVQTSSPSATGRSSQCDSTCRNNRLGRIPPA